MKTIIIKKENGTVITSYNTLFYDDKILSSYISDNGNGGFFTSNNGTGKIKSFNDIIRTPRGLFGIGITKESLHCSVDGIVWRKIFNISEFLHHNNVTLNHIKVDGDTIVILMSSVFGGSTIKFIYASWDRGETWSVVETSDADSMIVNYLFDVFMSTNKIALMGGFLYFIARRNKTIYKLNLSTGVIKAVELVGYDQIETIVGSHFQHIFSHNNRLLFQFYPQSSNLNIIEEDGKTFTSIASNLSLSATATTIYADGDYVYFFRRIDDIKYVTSTFECENLSFVDFKLEYLEFSIVDIFEDTIYAWDMVKETIHVFDINRSTKTASYRGVSNLLVDELRKYG